MCSPCGGNGGCNGYQQVPPPVCKCRTLCSPCGGNGGCNGYQQVPPPVCNCRTLSSPCGGNGGCNGYQEVPPPVCKCPPPVCGTVPRCPRVCYIKCQTSKLNPKCGKRTSSCGMDKNKSIDNKSLDRDGLNGAQYIAAMQTSSTMSKNQSKNGRIMDIIGLADFPDSGGNTRGGANSSSPKAYSDLLCRFNLLKDRMEKFPNEGDKQTTRDSCIILEEETQEHSPCIGGTEPKGISASERVMSTKVCDEKCGSITERVIESTQFMQDKVTRIKKHVMEKCENASQLDGDNGKCESGEKPLAVMAITKGLEKASDIEKQGRKFGKMDTKTDLSDDVDKSKIAKSGKNKGLKKQFPGDTDKLSGEPAKAPTIPLKSLADTSEVSQKQKENLTSTNSELKPNETAKEPSKGASPKTKENQTSIKKFTPNEKDSGKTKTLSDKTTKSKSPGSSSDREELSKEESSRSKDEQRSAKSPSLIQKDREKTKSKSAGSSSDQEELSKEAPSKPKDVQRTSKSLPSRQNGSEKTTRSKAINEGSSREEKRNVSKARNVKDMASPNPKKDNKIETRKRVPNSSGSLDDTGEENDNCFENQNESPTQFSDVGTFGRAVAKSDDERSKVDYFLKGRKSQSSYSGASALSSTAYPRDKSNFREADVSRGSYSEDMDLDSFNATPPSLDAVDGDCSSGYSSPRHSRERTEASQLIYQMIIPNEFNCELSEPDDCDEERIAQDKKFDSSQPYSRRQLNSNSCDSTEDESSMNSMRRNRIVRKNNNNSRQDVNETSLFEFLKSVMIPVFIIAPNATLPQGMGSTQTRSASCNSSQDQNPEYELNTLKEKKGRIGKSTPISSSSSQGWRSRNMMKANSSNSDYRHSDENDDCSSHLEHNNASPRSSKNGYSHDKDTSRSFDSSRRRGHNSGSSVTSNGVYRQTEESKEPHGRECGSFRSSVNGNGSSSNDDYFQDENPREDMDGRDCDCCQCDRFGNSGQFEENKSGFKNRDCSCSRFYRIENSGSSNGFRQAEQTKSESNGRDCSCCRCHRNGNSGPSSNAFLQAEGTKSELHGHDSCCCRCRKNEISSTSYRKHRGEKRRTGSQVCYCSVSRPRENLSRSSNCERYLSQEKTRQTSRTSSRGKGGFILPVNVSVVGVEEASRRVSKKKRKPKCCNRRELSGEYKHEYLEGGAEVCLPNKDDCKDDTSSLDGLTCCFPFKRFMKPKSNQNFRVKETEIKNFPTFTCTEKVDSLCVNLPIDEDLDCEKSDANTVDRIFSGKTTVSCKENNSGKQRTISCSCATQTSRLNCPTSPSVKFEVVAEPCPRDLIEISFPRNTCASNPLVTCSQRKKNTVTFRVLDEIEVEKTQKLQGIAALNENCDTRTSYGTENSSQSTCCENKSYSEDLQSSYFDEGNCEAHKSSSNRSLSQNFMDMIIPKGSYDANPPKVCPPETQSQPDCFKNSPLASKDKCEVETSFSICSLSQAFMDKVTPNKSCSANPLKTHRPERKPQPDRCKKRESSSREKCETEETCSICSLTLKFKDMITRNEDCDAKLPNTCQSSSKHKCEEDTSAICALPRKLMEMITPDKDCDVKPLKPCHPERKTQQDHCKKQQQISKEKCEEDTSSIRALLMDMISTTKDCDVKPPKACCADRETQPCSCTEEAFSICAHMITPNKDCDMKSQKDCRSEDETSSICSLPQKFVDMITPNKGCDANLPLTCRPERNPPQEQCKKRKSISKEKCEEDTSSIRALFVDMISTTKDCDVKPPKACCADRETQPCSCTEEAFSICAHMITPNKDCDMKSQKDCRSEDETSSICSLPQKSVDMITPKKGCKAKPSKTCRRKWKPQQDQCKKRQPISKHKCEEDTSSICSVPQKFMDMITPNKGCDANLPITCRPERNPLQEQCKKRQSISKDKCEEDTSSIRGLFVDMISTTKDCDIKPSKSCCPDRETQPCSCKEEAFSICALPQKFADMITPNKDCDMKPQKDCRLEDETSSICSLPQKFVDMITQKKGCKAKPSKTFRLKWKPQQDQCKKRQPISKHKCEEDISSICSVPQKFMDMITPNKGCDANPPLTCRPERNPLQEQCKKRQSISKDKCEEDTSSIRGLFVDMISTTKDCDIKPTKSCCPDRETQPCSCKEEAFSICALPQKFADMITPNKDCDMKPQKDCRPEDETSSICSLPQKFVDMIIPKKGCKAKPSKTFRLKWKPQQDQCKKRQPISKHKCEEDTSSIASLPQKFMDMITPNKGCDVNLPITFRPERNPPQEKCKKRQSISKDKCEEGTSSICALPQKFMDMIIPKKGCKAKPSKTFRLKWKPQQDQCKKRQPISKHKCEEDTSSICSRSQKFLNMITPNKDCNIKPPKACRPDQSYLQCCEIKKTPKCCIPQNFLDMLSRNSECVDQTYQSNCSKQQSFTFEHFQSCSLGKEERDVEKTPSRSCCTDESSQSNYFEAFEDENPTSCGTQYSESDCYKFLSEENTEASDKSCSLGKCSQSSQSTGTQTYRHLQTYICSNKDCQRKSGRSCSGTQTHCEYGIQFSNILNEFKKNMNTVGKAEEKTCDFYQSIPSSSKTTGPCDRSIYGKEATSESENSSESFLEEDSNSQTILQPIIFPVLYQPTFPDGYNCYNPQEMAYCNCIYQYVAPQNSSWICSNQSNYSNSSWNLQQFYTAHPTYFQLPHVQPTNNGTESSTSKKKQRD